MYDMCMMLLSTLELCLNWEIKKPLWQKHQLIQNLYFLQKKVTFIGKMKHPPTTEPKKPHVSSVQEHSGHKKPQKTKKTHAKPANNNRKSHSFVSQAAKDSMLKFLEENGYTCETLKMKADREDVKYFWESYNGSISGMKYSDFKTLVHDKACWCGKGCSDTEMVRTKKRQDEDRMLRARFASYQ